MTKFTPDKYQIQEHVHRDKSLSYDVYRYVVNENLLLIIICVLFVWTIPFIFITELRWKHIASFDDLDSAQKYIDLRTKHKHTIHKKTVMQTNKLYYVSKKV